MTLQRAKTSSRSPKMAWNKSKSDLRSFFGHQKHLPVTPGHPGWAFHGHFIQQMQGQTQIIQVPYPIQACTGHKDSVFQFPNSLINEYFSMPPLLHCICCLWKKHVYLHDVTNNGDIIILKTQLKLNSCHSRRERHSTLHHVIALLLTTATWHGSR